MKNAASPSVKYLVLTICTFVLTGVACAVPLVSFTFDDPSDGQSGFSYTDDGSGATATIANGSLGKFDVGPDNGYGNVLRTAPTSITFPTGHADLKQAAIDNSWYFSIRLQSPSPFDLSSIALDVGRGGSSGTRGFFIRSSSDNYGSDLFYYQDLQDVSGMNPYAVDLSGLAPTSDETFRFYSYTNLAGRYVDYGGIDFYKASTVPDTGSAAVLLGTLFLFAFFLRRNQFRI